MKDISKRQYEKDKLLDEQEKEKELKQLQKERIRNLQSCYSLGKF